MLLRGITVNRIKTLLIALAVASPASTARAGLFTDIFRGLEIAATPSGSPVNPTGTGFRVNGARSGRLRIVPASLRRGYRLEFDRTFGPDSSGRPEVFDFGNYEIQLAGAVNATAQVTGRGLKTGNTVINFNNLNYAIRAKSGAQDATLTGTLNANQTLEINPLGFYSLLIDVGNTNSQADLTGLAADGSTDTDFDIGPIAIKGNVFFDITVAMLAGLGVDTQSLQGVFPDSPIDRIVASINERRAGKTGSSLLSDPPFDASTPALSLSGDVLRRDLLSVLLNQSTAPAGPDGPSAVPEPSSIALLLLGGIAALSRRFR